MSVIAKTPFIKKVIGSLTSEQLSALAVLIDNSASYPTFRSLVNKDALITTDDKGVKHITLETKDRKFTGYLLYNNTYCVLVAYYNNTQQMQIIKIANNDYQLVNEELSILDFRATIIEKLKADLVNGKIPASQLPSYVDDVIEGYYYNDKFYSDLSHTEEITGETGKIYVDLATGNTYRWSGTVYAQIGGGGAKVVEVQLTAQNETDLLTNGSVTVALSAADGADLIGSELNMIKLEGASLGDMYLYKGNGGTDNSFYFLSLDTTLIGTASFDGTDYSLYLVTNQPLEVVGNPTIPSGTTPTPLQALRINNEYFNIDKPIHFIKLTSTTLTEALRSEILSDEYFVILEYNSMYFYEREIFTDLKRFETMPTSTSTGTNNYDRYVITQYYSITITSTMTAISLINNSSYSIDSSARNVPALKINSKTSSSTNATAGKVLTADGSGGTSWETPGGGIDTDVTVEIESDYTNDSYASRTNYATAISLQEFIANCEADNVYTNAGIIAKINNLINGKAFRLILIGTNHEVLAYDDTTTAKTTWQFLDMPEHNVRLGLPFNLLDWVSGSGRQYLMEYLNGINGSSMDLYPSNMDGLISAQGLLEAAHSIFEELPDTLKRHIKTVRRYYYRKRNTMSVGANGGSESNSGQMCQLACNVFHLAGTDLGTSGQSGEGSGSKYAYFTGSARRIRFYNGTATSWWNASPYTSDTNHWYSITSSGNHDNNSTNSYYGVAPAICI